jgi:putative two-component system response regulator
MTAVNRATTIALNMPVVMIVDDVPENIRVIGYLLAPHYRVRTANSGRSALELIALSPKPDLILLDIMMADMDGYEVLAHLKADAATREIPVIFLTAMDTSEDETMGFKLGAVDYITKPIRPAILQARIRTHLELKQARDILKDQNVFLEAEVAKRMAENELIQDVSIHSLAHLAEIRDPETGNHLRRTSGYVQVLAQHLQSHHRFDTCLSGCAIQLLTKSAPLHDIGKVGIPDHVLLKPGPLTEPEWQIMKMHARLGAEAIEKAEQDADRPVEFLKFAKEIARWHHEKWDGSGYPDGLKADEIPVSARLMALADVFDALISPRIYKPAMSFECARDIIADGRGVHFDPDIVDAFFASFDKFVGIASRYSDDTSALFSQYPSYGEPLNNR